MRNSLKLITALGLFLGIGVLQAEVVPGIIIDDQGELLEVQFVRLANDSVEYLQGDDPELKKMYKLDVRRVEITVADSLQFVDLTLRDFEVEFAPEVPETVAEAPPVIKGRAVLRVNSNPDGARVYVDGELIPGVTPLVIPELNGQKTAIMVRKYLKGVDWWGQSEVVLKDGDTTALEIKLLKPHTQFSVQSIPKDAEVYIDAKPSLNALPKYISDTVITNIRPGPLRQVTFFKVGYYDTTVVTDIIAFMPNLLGVDLRPISEDLAKLDQQLDFVKRRHKRWIGRGLWYSAIAPVVASGVVYYLGNRDWAKAADYKYMYEDAAFHSTETDRFIRENDKYNERGDLKAKIAAGLGAAGLVLVVSGAVLHF